jgi:hypothetical protein
LGRILRPVYAVLLAIAELRCDFEKLVNDPIQLFSPHFASQESNPIFRAINGFHISVTD